MKLSIGIALAIAIAAYTSAARAQGFDCRKARHPDEKLVCEEPELSQLDSELNAVFWRVKRQLPSSEDRVPCCGVGAAR